MDNVQNNFLSQNLREGQHTVVPLTSLWLEYIPESSSELKQNFEHTSLFILTQAADKNN